MNETLQIILLIVQTLIIPALTVAFMYGVTSGKLQALANSLKKNCDSITRAHTRIDEHTNKHCLDCPGSEALKKR